MTITIFGTKDNKIFETSFRDDYDNIIKLLPKYLINATIALKKVDVTPDMFVIWEHYNFGKVEDLTIDVIKKYEHNSN